MRHARNRAFSLASLALAGALASVGCQARPMSRQAVDPSVLPAAAKSMLSSDAQVTRVEEEMYTKGTKLYVISYTVNGREEQIKYNPKEQSTPTGVFEFPNNDAGSVHPMEPTGAVSPGVGVHSVEPAPERMIGQHPPTR